MIESDAPWSTTAFENGDNSVGASERARKQVDMDGEDADTEQKAEVGSMAVVAMQGATEVIRDSAAIREDTLCKVRLECQREHSIGDEGWGA